MEETKQEPDSFLKDLKSNIKLRLGNKLIFSYIITWCVWNWRFLFFVILSGKSVELKLSTYTDYLSYWDPFIPLIGVTFYYLALDWLEGFFLSISKWGVDFRLQKHIEIEVLKIEAEIEISQERIDLINEFAKTNNENIDQAVEMREKLQKLEESNADLQERMKGVKTTSGSGPVPSNDPRTKTILAYFETNKPLKEAFFKHANSKTLFQKSDLNPEIGNSFIELDLLDKDWKLTRLGNDVFYKLLS
nr:hypothetical protein [uncultured Fluviicola sp.]